MSFYIFIFVALYFTIYLDNKVLSRKNDKTVYGRWFLGESKALSTYCSVFGCQGLELDYPIIKFGEDYIRKNGSWNFGGYRHITDKHNNNNKNINEIVENNYRVLLTRGRYGMILFIPENKIFNETYEYFKSMGIKEL